MWRDTKNNNQRGKDKISSNRLRLIVAVIFLLSFALIYKLFNVQIKQCDWYTALAASQHQVYSKLKPERGKIFLRETIGGQEKLYPIATNKDFAFLYVVPQDITDPPAFADKLFAFFYPSGAPENLSAPAVDSAAASSASESAAPIQPDGAGSVASSSAAIQKEKIIAGYLKKVDKPGDPYEPLENKLSDEALLRLYAFFANSSSTPVKAEELELKNEKIVYKNDETKELKVPGLGFDLKKYRYYPENEIGSHLLGFVSYTDEEEKGNYGLEEFFNDELFGKYGSVKSERGGENGTMIVNDREYLKPEAGSDLILTIDRNVEFVACAKLKEAVKKHGATGGSVIALNPKTGAIIAMCSVPDFNPNNYKQIKDISIFNNPALLYQYEPGSVFKTVTMSIAIDQGKVSPSTTYKDDGQIMIKGWNKPISNSDFSTHGPHGVVDMNTVLENSLNTGAIFAMRQVGPKVFADYVKNYGFGEKTGIELGAEGNGNVGNLLKSKVREIDAATASFGQGIAATPLQMIMPYQAIANHGVMMKPFVVEAIVRGDKREDTKPQIVRRVISEKTAATMSAMLVNVVEKGHSKKSSISGYYIGGKTGTAQIATAGGYKKNEYIHTFVGIVPIEDPAFVMLTKIDSPKDVTYAEGSVVPLWRDIADFMLKYYQIPKTRTQE